MILQLFYFISFHVCYVTNKTTQIIFMISTVCVPLFQASIIPGKKCTLSFINASKYEVTHHINIKYPQLQIYLEKALLIISKNFKKNI